MNDEVTTQETADEEVETVDIWVAGTEEPQFQAARLPANPVDDRLVFGPAQGDLVQGLLCNC